MIRPNLQPHDTTKMRDSLHNLRDAEMPEFIKRHAWLGIYPGTSKKRDVRAAAVEAVRAAQIRCNMTAVDEAVRAVKAAQKRCAVE